MPVSNQFGIALHFKNGSSKETGGDRRKFLADKTTCGNKQSATQVLFTCNFHRSTTELCNPSGKSSKHRSNTKLQRGQVEKKLVFDQKDRVQTQWHRLLKL